MDNSENAISRSQAQAMVQPKTNVLAIVSLVSGVFGVFFFGSLIAVICGHIARSQIRYSHGRETGDVLAVVGMVLGYLMLAFTVLIIFAVLVFGISLAGLNR